MKLTYWLQIRRNAVMEVGADQKSIMILDWWLSPELQVSSDPTPDRSKAALTASSAAQLRCFLNGVWIAYSSGRQRKESEYT